MPLELKADLDQVEALIPEREALWARLNAAAFLTDDEKRAAAGYPPLPRSAKFNPYHDEAGRFTTADGAVAAGSGGRSSRDKNNQLAMAKIIGAIGKVFGKVKVPKVPKPPASPKFPDFLSKRPGTGKLSGDLKELSKSEQKIAEDLKDLGHDVEIVPRGTGRTPDFKINGVEHELKTVSGVQRTDPDGLSSAISNRIMNGRGQASNIIVDAREQAGMTKDIAERSLSRAFGADTKNGIDTITILTRDGPVHAVRRQ